VLIGFFLYLCRENKSNLIKKITMAKKRKLNSKNPKYMEVSEKDVKVEVRRTKVCMVPTRDSSGKLTNTKIPAYGVWYK